MASDDSSPAETSGEVIGDKSIDGFVFLLFFSICNIYAIQFISEVLLVESDIFFLNLICFFFYQIKCILSLGMIYRNISFNFGNIKLFNFVFLFRSSPRKKGHGKVPKKIHKAEREKLKRDQLNDLFCDLHNMLGMHVINFSCFRLIVLVASKYQY